MLSIDLNCDLGEGFPNDHLIFPYITSANIACKGHAGDEVSMTASILSALKYNVAIGAHPGYYDAQNFGRVDMLYNPFTVDEVKEMVADQVTIMRRMCVMHSAPQLHHVKLHGALYNRAAKDKELARAVCEAIKREKPSALVYGLSGSTMEKAAAAFNLQFVHEVFADRTYQPDGSLTPRTEANALIKDINQCIAQVLMMVKEGKVKTVTGEIIPIKAETICLHGDGDHAVDFAKAIHTALLDNHITLKSPPKNEQR